MAFNQTKPLDLLYLGTYDYYMAEVKFGGIQVSGGLVLNDVRNNIRIGIDAVASATTGTYNIGFGAQALQYLTVGTRNTALGQMAMTDAGGPLCSDNLAVGYMAFSNVANAQRCVVLGTFAAQNAENPVDMVIIGTNAVGNPALPLGYAAANSVIIGNSAGYNGPANYNVVIGYEAGFSLIVPVATPVDNGRKNVVVGYQALFSALSPDRCVVLGSEAAYGASDGIDLVVIGTHALAGANAQTEVSSVVIGNSAGYTAGGSYNVICGHESGYAVPHGSDENVFIGYRSARAVDGASTKNIVIGSACCTWPDAGQTGNAGTMTMSSSVAIGTDCNRRPGAASDYAVNLVRTTLMGVECGYCLTRSAAATLTDCVFIGQRSGTFAVPITALNSSVAIGNQCTFNGTGTISNTVVIGYTAATNSNNSVVIGSNSSATATNTVVMGYNSKATQSNSVVIGQASEGTYAAVVAIGDTCKAQAANTVAIGNQCTVAGTGSVAVGTNSGGVAASAVMIGDTCVADANSVVAVGSGCAAHGDNAVVVGQGSSSSGGTATVVIGQSSTSTAGNNSVVIGQGSSSATSNAVVVGQGSQSTAGNNSVVIGQGSTSAGGNVIAIGFICAATADDAVVIGKQSSSSATQSVVMGTLASSTSTSSVVVGYNSHATGVGTHSTVVIGDSCTTASNDCVVIGTSCAGTGPNSVSIGSSAKGGDSNVCVGMYSGAAGPDAYNTLIGYNCGASLTVQAPVDDGCYNTMLGYRSGESLQTTTKKTVVVGSDCCRTVNAAQKMTAVSSVAIGDSCVYRGNGADFPVNLDSTVVIGTNGAACATRTAAATVLQSVFVGCSAGTFDPNNTAVSNNVAVGYNCSLTSTAATVSDNVLVGSTCTTSGSSSVVIGTVGSGAANAVVVGNYGTGAAHAVVIGTSGDGATDAVVIGSSGQGASGAVAIGTSCYSATNSVVLGYGGRCGLNDAVAIGTSAVAGQFSVYIGNGPGPANIDTGAYNVMIGCRNGYKATYLSQYNVFAGYQCCYDPGSSESLGCGQCVVLGANAAPRIGAGRDVVCIGNAAMGSTSGSGYAAVRVVCMGTNAGYSRPGDDVICIGSESGHDLTSTGGTDGTSIVCIGSYAGSRLVSANDGSSTFASTIIGTSCCTTSNASNTTALQSVAIGNMCAYADMNLNLARSIVIGQEAAKCMLRYRAASFTDCVVLGTQAAALPPYIDYLLSSVVIGTNAACTGNYAIVVGSNCTAVNDSCVVIGDTSKGNTSTVAIGYHCGTNTTTTNSVILGTNACNTANAVRAVTCTSSVAIGDTCAYRSDANDYPVDLSNTVVIGTGAASCPVRTSNATLTDCVLVGNATGIFPSTITSLQRCTTIGKDCTFTWAGIPEYDEFEITDHVLIGNTASSSANTGDVVIGNRGSGGGQSVAIGTKAHADSLGVAIGCESSAALGSIALGFGAVASDTFTTVIGNGQPPLQTTITTIHGYTQIGGGSDIYVPAIRMLLLEGTTGAAGSSVTVQANLGEVTFPKYLTAAQIISITGTIQNNQVPPLAIPPFISSDINSYWELFYTPGAGNGAVVRLGASANTLASRPFRVLIIYGGFIN